MIYTGNNGNGIFKFKYEFNLHKGLEVAEPTEEDMHMV